MREKAGKSAVRDLSGRVAIVTGGGWLGRGVLGADEPIPKVRRRRR
jgi:hypothetical protein